MYIFLIAAYSDVLGSVVEQSHCEASVSSTEITDLAFANDAIVFAKSLEVLVMALEQGFLTGGIHTPWGFGNQMLGVWDSISGYWYLFNLIIFTLG